MTIQGLPPKPHFGNVAAAAVRPEVYEPGFVTKTFYPAMEWLMEAPGKVDSFFSTKKITAAAGEELSVLSRVFNWAVGVAHSLSNKMVDHDYREYPSIPKAFGKSMTSFLGDNISEKVGTLLSKIKVSEPPIGALILLLYPFTVLPRLFRAAKRDIREVGDVMRRDITAITIFLFSLKPLVAGLTRLTEKFDGLHMIHRDGEHAGQVFTYKQMENNLRIANPKTLLALVQNRQDKALQNATFFLSDGGLKKAGENPALYQLIQDFKGKLDELIGAVANQKDNQKVLSEEAFNLLQKMDTFRDEARKNVSKGADAAISKLAEKLPEFKNFFVRYAKARRLPIDIFSFVLVCVGIGWFPVWFNDYWNRKKFAEKMAAKNQTDPVDPAMLFSALKGSSRLGKNFQ